MTIEKLCRLHWNEDAHTRHVTGLALQLFDSLCIPLGISRRERKILKAACALHDIGYRRDPVGHCGASAQIVLKAPFENFSASERRLVAAVILLHQRKYESALRDPLVRTLPQPQAALRLAAFLRIADGLDHSHIQDSTIHSIEVKGGKAVVRLDALWYEKNVSRAETKADLWRKLFDLGIEFSALPGPPEKPLFFHVVRKGDNALDAFRRIAFSQFRVFTGNYLEFLSSGSPSGLHDLRVALRRLKNVFALVSPDFQPGHYGRIMKYLRATIKRTGEIRDCDVVLELLKKPAFGKETGPAAGNLERKRKTAGQVLHRFFKSSGHGQFMGDVSRVLRVDCSGSPAIKSVSAKQMAAVNLGKACRKLFERKIPKKPTPGELHALRRKIRSARYRSEFFAPLFGPAVSDLSIRLKKASDIFGDIHDLDIAIDFPAGSVSLVRPPRTASGLPFEAGSAFLHKMTKRRAKRIAEARKTWKELTRSSFLKPVFKELKPR